MEIGHAKWHGTYWPRYQAAKQQLFIPSKPRLAVTVFRLYIYGFSEWLLMQLTHAHTATARVSSHVHSTCTNFVLSIYIAYMC